MKKILKIKGMHCSSCEILLKEAIAETGTKVLSANHQKGEISIELMDEKEMGAIKLAVEKEGYSLT